MTQQDNWPFMDPPNVAVITTREIVEGRSWIAHVSHDMDDGAWQFIGVNGPGSEEEARVVSLSAMIRLDPTITELADLPLGWRAWRETETGRWNRKPAE
jgi:hypothetical protein